ncbi:zf-HC2 domain-containing protein [Streptomyces sp. NPDC046831]|uniref:anti-sigma factor family protein n=1 Tax=Streptomyces sp. NPDC046831 TaxID=3154805 RepID=UPI003409DA58
MSGSRPDPAAGQLAEQHLGDRLSALVDGELGHEARERVLAHVATCPKCKAEVDAQRRLKNVFAETAPPPPSESFLARLQGLPAGDGTDGGGSLLGGGAFGGIGGSSGRSGAFDVERGGRFSFGYVPAGPHADGPLAATADRGFRIHPVGRPDGDRPSSRGLRLAFAAAGAVSLAAIALGGVAPGITAGDTAAEARGGSRSGSNMTPARTAGTGAATAPDSSRRRSAGAPSAQGPGVPGRTAPTAPTAPSAPLLPGVPAPAAGRTEDVTHTLTTPVVAGAAVVSPLIRPLTTAPPVALTSWSARPPFVPPGILAAPVPETAAAPSPSVSPPGDPAAARQIR